MRHLLFLGLLLSASLSLAQTIDLPLRPCELLLDSRQITAPHRDSLVVARSLRHANGHGWILTYSLNQEMFGFEVRGEFDEVRIAYPMIYGLKDGEILLLGNISPERLIFALENEDAMVVHKVKLFDDVDLRFHLVEKNGARYWFAHLKRNNL